VVKGRRIATTYLMCCVAEAALGCKGKTTMNHNALSLHATFTRQDKELLLTYQVRNDAKRDVYLVNRLHTLTPFVFSPDVIYVELDPITKTIRFYKDHPTSPEEESPVVILSDNSPVRAGATFQEEVHIRLPVFRYTGYSSSRPPANGWPATYGHVYFSVAYWWRPEGAREELLDPYRTGTPFLTPVDCWPVPKEEQGILESDRVNLEVPVLERG
jgi:hypothetical protein